MHDSLRSALRARRDARWRAWQASRPCPWWAKLVLYTLAVALVAVFALFYGGSGARRGGVGDTLTLAALLGIATFVAVRLARCRNTLVTMPLAAAIGVLVVLAGHAVGYADAPQMAAAYFAAYPDELPVADRGKPEALFPAYVENATGTRGDSFLSYLRLQMSVGADTRRITRWSSYTITVSGLAVLLVWLVQLVLFPVAAAVGTVAGTPGFSDPPPTDSRFPDS